MHCTKSVLYSQDKSEINQVHLIGPFLLCPIMHYYRGVLLLSAVSDIFVLGVSNVCLMQWCFAQFSWNSWQNSSNLEYGFGC